MYRSLNVQQRSSRLASDRKQQADRAGGCRSSEAKRTNATALYMSCARIAKRKPLADRHASVETVDASDVKSTSGLRDNGKENRKGRADQSHPMNLTHTHKFTTASAAVQNRPRVRCKCRDRRLCYARQADCRHLRCIISFPPLPPPKYAFQFFVVRCAQDIRAVIVWKGYRNFKIEQSKQINERA